MVGERLTSRALTRLARKAVAAALEQQRLVGGPARGAARHPGMGR